MRERKPLPANTSDNAAGPHVPQHVPECGKSAPTDPALVGIQARLATLWPALTAEQRQALEGILEALPDLPAPILAGIRAMVRAACPPA